MRAGRAGRFASVDIGSNSVILLVAERDTPGERWRTVLDRVEITRISEGLDRAGTLSRVPIERTAAVLRSFGETMRELRVDGATATGTAPFRRSRNGPDVAQELSAVLGVQVDVVSGEEEASLSLLATRRSFPQVGRMHVVDIGGASTEIIAAGDGGESTRVSMDIGSVRLTERCVSADPIRAEDRRAMESEIREAMDRSGAAEVLGGSPATLVGIAGTVTTIAAISLGMREWDADVVHGHALARAEVARVTEMLFSRPLGERKLLDGLDPKRADVIPAGAQILRSLMEEAGADAVLVSDRGTRWGRLHQEFDPIGPT